MYEKEGGVLVIQLPDENIEHHFRTNEKIVTAFAACGISPELTIELFLHSLTLEPETEEDQFTQDEPPLRTEHVVTRLVRSGDKTIPVLDIEFYPPSAAGKPIRNIFTNTAEIIFGLGGEGVLEVAPVVHDEDTILLSADKANVTIRSNTLVILPPNIQGNRWISFGPSTETMPSLHALFVAFPVPYSQASEVPVDNAS